MARPRSVHRHQIQFNLLPQPDDATCGPTCLHALYDYFGDRTDLPRVVREVRRLKTGGTLAVFLGIHALRQGYRVTIYTYNLLVFDPTWFELEREELMAKLAAQAKAKRSAKLKVASRAYIRFLRLGGEVRFTPLSGRLIRRYLDRDLPILTGLSSTYLYGCPREYGPDDDPDDIRGMPAGHFVVLCGYDRRERQVVVADPLRSNPHSATRRYSIDINRVLSSILLGVLTYDANLLILEQPSTAPASPDRA
jgi:hypothetical protein